MAQKLNLNEFKASEGWLNKLKNRNGIVFREISGESGEVSEAIVDDWKSKLLEIISGYEPKNIYNFDETALFHKLLPKKSYMIRGKKTN